MSFTNLSVKNIGAFQTVLWLHMLVLRHATGWSLCWHSKSANPRWKINLTTQPDWVSNSPVHNLKVVLLSYWRGEAKETLTCLTSQTSFKQDMLWKGPSWLLAVTKDPWYPPCPHPAYKILLSHFSLLKWPGQKGSPRSKWLQLCLWIQG